MQFPFLLLVCKFTCSQNSSPERLLLRLKCKVCTPTCQLHELAVAIINSSEGQQTFTINGDWINSGICKIQTAVSLPEKFIHLIYTTSLPSSFSEMLQDPSNMNSSGKHHLPYSFMRIPHVLFFFFFLMSITPHISSITWPKWGSGPPARRQEHASPPLVRLSQLSHLTACPRWRERRLGLKLWSHVHPAAYMKRMSNQGA